MKRKQRTLTPPADVDPPAIHAEPDADIELLGEMVHDTETMERMLLALPFERGHYRSNLRVVLSTARRMVERCVRLLEEGMDPAAEPGTELWTHRGLPDLSTQVDRQPEASSLIDDLPADIPAGSRHIGLGVYVGPALNPDLAGDDLREAADPHPVRRNGKPPQPAPKPAPPEKTKGFTRRLTMTENRICHIVDIAGTATTTEILEDMKEQHPDVGAHDVNDALAALRTDGIVLTTRLGRGFINRLATEAS